MVTRRRTARSKRKSGRRADDSDTFGPVTEGRGTVATSQVLEGRLPLVMCEADLQGLKLIGRKLECELYEVLFAIFGLVIQDVASTGTGLTEFSVNEQCTSRLVVATHCSDAYAFRLDEQVMAGLVDGREGSHSSGRVSSFSGPGAAAFLYTRRWVRDDKLGDVRSDNPPVDRSVYSAFDLVAEVTEFQRHLLIECFFRGDVVGKHAVGRLLFRYASGLKAAVASPLRRNVP